MAAAPSGGGTAALQRLAPCNSPRQPDSLRRDAAGLHRLQGLGCGSDAAKLLQAYPSLLTRGSATLAAKVYGRV